MSTHGSDYYFKSAILTAVNLEPSFFQARAVMVYRLEISLALPSSHIPLRGLQFNILKLCKSERAKTI